VTDGGQSLAHVEKLLQALDALLGCVVERRVELRQAHHHLAQDIGHVTRLTQRAATERETTSDETASDEFVTVEGLHEIAAQAAEADRKLFLTNIGNAPYAHLDQLVRLAADPSDATVACRIGARQLVDHDRIEGSKSRFDQIFLHEDAPRRERALGRTSANGDGSSNAMFSRSRIHVESVIESARDRRFHPASSFGKTRTRRRTDLTGGLGM